MDGITNEELKWVLVDLDGTLAKSTPPPYTIGEPKLRMLEACRKASNYGYKIIIFTSRHSSEYREIEDWLVKYNVAHKFILTGKVLAKWIVDDTALRPGEFVNKMKRLP